MVKQMLGALIIHGLTASLDCVRPMKAPIEALGLPIRMPVLRGHGAKSPDALRGVVWQDWVADAEAALQDLLTEVDRAIVIGHSMGGLVAITLGADHAGDGCLDSLVLAAPGGQAASPLAPGRPLAFLLPVVSLLKRRHMMPPVRADRTLEANDTNFPWAPIDAVQQVPRLLSGCPCSTARDHHACPDRAEPQRQHHFPRERDDRPRRNRHAGVRQAHCLVQGDRARDALRFGGR